MKKSIFSLLFILCTVLLSATGGDVFHNAKLSVIKTEHFDIIFSEQTEEDAQKIASVAESYYEEICKKFNYDLQLRFPVTLTREVESLNGFYSPFPYNMIVLYVSSPDSKEMESYEDTLTSVFYHELTHAVTLNMKSPSLSVLSKIFGNFVSTSLVNMSYFWIEGAAVLGESNIGGKCDGRLKNPYFTSLLVQAKINDEAGIKKFPSWRDTAGVRDTVPGGSDRYVFGACFASYLTQTYGMEKYAELWKNAGEESSLSFISGVFKKTYGRSLDEAWNDFKDSIKIPSVSDENRALSFETLISKRDSCVSSCDVFFDRDTDMQKIIFYDSSSRAVFFTERNKGEMFSKNKKLLSVTGVTKLRFTEDGTKIFIERLVSKKTVKKESFIFDINTKKRRPVTVKEEYYESLPSVEKNKLEWAVIYKGVKYIPGEKIITGEPHILKKDAGETFISFSYARMAENNEDYKNLSLVKSGILKINEETGEGVFYLQKKDRPVSGVLHSVNDASLLYEDEGSLEFITVLESYEANPLYALSFPPVSDENFWEKILPAQEDKTVSEKDSYNGKETSFNVEKFSSFSYLKKRTLLPLSITPLKNSSFEDESMTFLGFTYVTSKPYLSGVLFFSGGYDPFYNDGGASFSFYDFDDSKSVYLTAAALFNEEGFMQSSFSSSLSKVLWRGLVSSASSGVSFNALYGRTAEEDLELTDKTEGKTYSGEVFEKGFFSSSEFYLSFSNLHKASAKHNNLCGITFQPFVMLEYNKFKYNWTVDGFSGEYESDSFIKEKYINAGAVFLTRIPGLFPLTLRASLFPSSKYFATAYSGVNLLTYEIQKGVPALSVYLSRLELNASYSAYLSYESEETFDILNTAQIARNITQEDFSDRASLTALLTLGPNTGYLADSSLLFKIGASFSYRFNKGEYKNRTELKITGTLGL